MERHWTVDTPSVSLAWSVQLPEFACGNNVEDEEEDAIDAAHEGSRKAMRQPRWGWKVQRPRWKGFAHRPKVFMILRTMSLSRGFASGISGTEATRGASSASTATIDAMGSEDERPGPAVPAPPPVDPYNFTLRVFGGEIAFFTSKGGGGQRNLGTPSIAAVFLRGLDRCVRIDRWV